MVTFSDTLDHISLIDIFRAFHPKAAEYTFFSSVYITFSRIDHILAHKTSLSRFKNIEIIPSIFSDHNAMKLEINRKKNTEKHTKAWKLNNMLLNNEWVTNEIMEEMKRCLETNENEDTTFRGTLRKQSLEGNAYHTGLSQTIKKKLKYII